MSSQQSPEDPSLHTFEALIQLTTHPKKGVFKRKKMISPLTFFQQVREELSKVTWPTQKEITRLTLLVIIVSLAVGLFIGGVDFLFTSAVAQLLK
jgi:preprotein translocase subunit SecE